MNEWNSNLKQKDRVNVALRNSFKTLDTELEEKETISSIALDVGCSEKVVRKLIDTLVNAKRLYRDSGIIGLSDKNKIERLCHVMDINEKEHLVKITGLTTTITELKQQLENAKTEVNSETQSQINNLNETITNLQHDIEAKDKIIFDNTTLQSKLDVANKTIEDQKQTIDKMTIDNVNLGLDNTLLRKSITALQLKIPSETGKYVSKKWLWLSWLLFGISVLLISYLK
ncbi:MAG: hypothetical protein NTW30_03645 [Candidatus Aenigmarchaeota archaeon]|nr:hypothetical protein [Candidatus Aenigmarchaeota archaeon]